MGHDVSTLSGGPRQGQGFLPTLRSEDVEATFEGAGALSCSERWLVRERLLASILAVALVWTVVACGQPAKTARRLADQASADPTSARTAVATVVSPAVVPAGTRSDALPPRLSTGFWIKKYGPMIVELRITPTDAPPRTVVHFAIRVTAPPGNYIGSMTWNPGVGIGWYMPGGLHGGEPCEKPLPPVNYRKTEDTRYKDHPYPPPGEYRPTFTVYLHTCRPDGSETGSHGSVEGRFTVRSSAAQS